MFFSNLIKFGVTRQIFVEVSKIKFNENRPVEAALIQADGVTDGQTDGWIEIDKGIRSVTLFILTRLERTVCAPRTKFVFDFTRDIFRRVS